VGTSVPANFNQGGIKMRIKQGRSGRYPDMGVITQIEDENTLLVGGTYKKRKRGGQSVQDMIDEMY